MNNLPPAITDYEPIDQDIKQLSLLHSSIKLKKSQMMVLILFFISTITRLTKDTVY